MIELIVLAQLAVIDCAPSHPGGDKRPPNWAWRTIENRQCWYEGPVMLPRERLRWAPAPAEAEPEPVIFPDPPTPLLTEFELRWRGEP